MRADKLWSRIKESDHSFQCDYAENMLHYRNVKRDIYIYIYTKLYLLHLIKKSFNCVHGQ